MANSKKKCKFCLQYIPFETGVKMPVGFFCNDDHMFKFINKKRDEKIAKQKEKAKKMNSDFAKVAVLPKAKQKEYLMSRTDWYDKLQKLVNQYVVHVRDVGKPCCTCDTTKPNLKYDAGHCFTRGARSELRYELTNLHIQCSNNCNLNNSGFQSKHKEFIASKYGAEHLAKLEDRTQWKSLKEQFPNTEDIKNEILRYRKILRDNGLTPRA